MIRIFRYSFLLLSAVFFTGRLSAQTERTVSLDEFLSQVESGNLSLAAERFNVSIAEAEALAARVFPDPELSFETGEDDFTLELGYTLELGGKRRARIRLAESVLKAEALALESYLEELRAEAAEAYFECATQRRILEFRRNSYEQMKRIAEADSIRHRLGEITELDARQSAVEAMAMLTEVYEQENEYTLSLIALNALTGRFADGTLLPIENSEPAESEYSLSGMIGMAMENRAEVRLYEQLTDAAYREWKLVKAERKIDLDVFVGYEKE